MPLQHLLAVGIDKWLTGHCLMAGMQKSISGEAYTNLIIMLCLVSLGLNMIVCAQRAKIRVGLSKTDHAPSPEGLQAPLYQCKTSCIWHSHLDALPGQPWSSGAK
jgi:hypothetical protein